MKRILVCVALFLVLAGVLGAQTGGTPRVNLTPLPPPPELAEPSDVGVLTRRTATGFQSLELQRAVARTHGGGLFSFPEQIYVLPGAHSPVRFAPGQTVEFYLRVLPESSDPRLNFLPQRDPNQFGLFRLKEEESERQIVQTDSTIAFFGRPFVVRMFAQHSFVLRTSEAPPPGEYAIQVQNQDYYCFAIDAPPIP